MPFTIPSPALYLSDTLLLWRDGPVQARSDTPPRHRRRHLQPHQRDHRRLYRTGRDRSARGSSVRTVLGAWKRSAGTGPRPATTQSRAARGTLDCRVGFASSQW